jgi:hypothetical protein
MKTISILTLVYIISTVFWGCTKEKVDPRIKADLDEIVYLINERLQQADTFEVYIYSPPTTNQNNYTVKTDNHHIYFDQHMLIVKPMNTRFSVEKYRLMSVKYRTRYPGEPRVIERMEISFNPE